MYGSYRPWEIANLSHHYIRRLLSHPRDDKGIPLLSRGSPQALSYRESFFALLRQNGLTEVQILDLWEMNQQRHADAAGNER